jgi:hypothetical protein
VGAAPALTAAAEEGPRGSYWRAQPFVLHPPAMVEVLPLAEDAFARPGGAQAAWATLPDAARSRVRETGFVVRPRAQSPPSLADFYAALARDRVPAVLTVDALFRIAHLAFDRALAEVDATMVDTLKGVLAILDDRLSREERGTKSDLVAAYQRAHGIVAVARGLLDPSREVAPSIAPAVRTELEKIGTHAGAAPSPMLDQRLDYSAFDVQGGLAESDARLGAFRAITWLGLAALRLGTRGEPNAVLRVDELRTDTRAALILAHLMQEEAKSPAVVQWDRLDSTSDFVSGPQEDLAPRDLLRIAAREGIDARDVATLLDVVRLDKLRSAASREGPPPSVRDLAIIVSADGTVVPYATARLLGPSATPDGHLLGRLVTPMVGQDPRGHARTVPSCIDVVAWLGSAEARAAQRDGAAGAHAGYLAALDDTAFPKVGESQAHATLYLSWLDAVSTYVRPSMGAAAWAPSRRNAWDRRSAVVAAGAWATLRHDAMPMTHASAHDVPALPVLRAPAGSAPVPVAVEPHPEAIARLAAFVGQLERGLGAHGFLALGSAARDLVVDVHAVLVAALDLAVAEVNGEEAPAAALATLADLPAILARIETRAGGGALAPLVADVHSDLRSGRVLAVGTAPADDVWVVLPDPATRQPTLFMGPHVGARELPVALRMNDTEWAKRVPQVPRLPIAEGFAVP